MSKLFTKAWSAAALLAIAFHVTYAVFIPVADTFLNAGHLSIVLGLGFSWNALEQGRQWSLRCFDTLLAVLGFAVGIYFILFESTVFGRFELPLTDQVIAWLAVFLVLELTRRLTGWVIPAIAMFLMLYVLYLGKHLPGIFFFNGLSGYRMAYRMFWQDGALLGTTTTISATIIFLFVFLSSLMQAAGATQFIIAGALRLMRSVPGGSAHVAVLSSAVMGTVSGSAVANVVGTGTITIPMMKRAGLKPEFAAGVEAAASTGSQLVPPIMGAGIFIMSDWTGIPYTELVLLAIVPAVLYFLSISLNIHLDLKKNGLLDVAVAEEAAQPVRLIEGLAFLAPIGSLVALLTIGYSPVYAAAWSCLAVVLCSFFTSHPLGPSRWLDIARSTLQTLMPTAIVLICAGIIVICVETSGLVVAMAQSLTVFGQHNILLVLILLAVISLFLGMGLPVTASYIVVASFGAQALIALGASPAAAHMAIFWLSQDSLLTPPVCLAAYAASGIAGGNPAQTGLRAMLLGKGLYLMPVLFIFHGLLFDHGNSAALHATATGAAAITCFAMASIGMAAKPLNALERISLGLAFVVLLWPDWHVQCAGLALACFSVGSSVLRPPRAANVPIK